MRIIYEPSGKALEYAPLALNIFKKCQHGCRYCFGPATSRVLPEDYFSGHGLKDDVCQRVESDAQALQEAGDTREILLSFIGDVYQPGEAELGITRAVIKILMAHERPFTILTKGGMRAARDFDLLAGYPKCSFGTTLIFSDQSSVDEWEPGAASVRDRIEAIEKAKAMGIRTWISMEPVIDPVQALTIIKDLHSIVDHWKVGKINHYPEIERSVDWIAFRKKVKSLMTEYGASYYLKKSLTEL
ncbi:MAG: hypothetical protein C4576_11420 [Desulfobacteraceae bacterium]|nr:MAG: hypothetical protein C4576_11420 [Desulfobacteraceae bacterium]